MTAAPLVLAQPMSPNPNAWGTLRPRTAPSCRRTGELQPVRTLLVACDGQEALTCFEQNSDGIDLLVLDVMMPRLGGLDVLREIRKATPRMPAVFCTGYSSEVISRTVAGPVTWVLRKPFLPSLFLGTVRDALDRSRTRW